MYKENTSAKQGWIIVVIIKNTLLIDSDIFLEFWAKTMETANYFQNRFFYSKQNKRAST